jgi:sigma-B regulation protein RsbU (phosphoserine phosphatase)
VKPRVLAILFGALLTCYSVGWMYLVRQQSAIVLGMEPRFHPLTHEVEITGVLDGGPAAAAGLAAGDRIQAIDGRRIDTYDTFHDLRRHGSPGQVVRLQIRRGATTRELPLRLIARSELTATAATAVWLRPSGIVALVQQVLALYPIPFLVVALAVLLQRPEDPHAWLLAAMLGGFIAGAPISEFEYRIPSALRGPLLALWVLLNVPLPAVTYAFFSVFPAHSPLDRRVPWLKTAAVGIAWALALALAVGLLLGRGSYVLWWLGDRFEGWGGVAGIVGTIYSVGFTLLALVSLLLNAFGPTDVRRKTRVILFGVVVGTLPIVVLQVIIGALGIPPQRLPFWFWAFSVLSLFAIPLSLGYAVVKHRAMEIPVLLRRSARYLLVRRGLVTLTILAGVGVTLGFARLFDRFLVPNSVERTQASLLLGSVFGGCIALLGRKAWQPAMDRLDQAFFRGAYDARRLLVTLAEQSRTANDRATLAELIDHSIVQALHPSTLLVFLRGGDDWTFDAAAHEGLVGDAARLPATPTFLNDLARRGRPLLVDLEQLEPGGSLAEFAPLAPEALVPMVGRSGQIEGLLVLGSRLSEEPYSGEDVSLLASVGTQAGLALENIRLAESMATRLDVERRAARELEIAHDVQSKLLPQNRPVLDTIDYAAACLQARVVGGDYFDFVSFAPERFGLVLADISGKGISAALLMASLQANLRAQYAQAPDNLARVLTSVNKVFFESTAPNHYATLFFGVYDERTRRMQYANCGHLPPIVVRNTGEVERLLVTAPVVGLFDQWVCHTFDIEMRPGDVLVVFTDGVSDATSSEGEEFGEERLIALVTRCRTLAAADLLDTIVRDVRAHSGPEQFDDLTLIVARAR